MVRVALITGASRGIGAATALVLAEHGYRVVVNHRASAPQAEEVVATIAAAGGDAIAIKADVTVPNDVAAMVDEIAQRWLTRDEVQRYYERYVGPYFTSDGRVDLNVAQHAVNAVATELGVAAASVDQIVPARPVTAAARIQHSSA